LLSRCVDPSVVDDDDAFSVDPALDPFAEHNGYRPAPASGIVGFGRLSTPDAWLSTWSAHSSNATIAKTGPDVHLPTLLISYTADNCVFPGDFDAICDAVASPNREIHRVAADHYGNPAPSTELRRDHVAPRISRWRRELE
jgi:hypothetical protein